MVHNANQVALLFSGLPREQAIEAIRHHIMTFWDQAVRSRLVEYVATDGNGLHELVVEAVKRMPVDA
jgi:formate dehydrogenase subunit delta